MSEARANVTERHRIAKAIATGEYDVVEGADAIRWLASEREKEIAEWYEHQQGATP